MKIIWHPFASNDFDQIIYYYRDAFGVKQLKKSATHFIMTYIICSVYILFWDSVKPV